MVSGQGEQALAHHQHTFALSRTFPSLTQRRLLSSCWSSTTTSSFSEERHSVAFMRMRCRKAELSLMSTTAGFQATSESGGLRSLDGEQHGSHRTSDFRKLFQVIGLHSYSNTVVNKKPVRTAFDAQMCRVLAKVGEFG